MTERRLLLSDQGVKESPEEYADFLFGRVAAKNCVSCTFDSPVNTRLADKFLDTKLAYVRNRKSVLENLPVLDEFNY